MLMSCSRKRHRDEDKTTEDENVPFGLNGIPSTPSSHNTQPGVIFVLENASLSLAFVGKRYQILNADEHADYLRKKNMDPYNFRPDIVHEALLEIMGSRLCMAGKLAAVYIRTDQGILIKVEPNVQIPQTLGRFCNMMSQLLQKLSIKASGNRKKLLNLVENPVTKHLPINSRKIGFSFSSQKAVGLQEYVSAFNDNESLVFVVGAMAHGKIDCKYVDDFVSVSGYPLSAAACLGQICMAVERKWRIL